MYTNATFLFNNYYKIFSRHKHVNTLYCSPHTFLKIHCDVLKDLIMSKCIHDICNYFTLKKNKTYILYRLLLVLLIKLIFINLFFVLLLNINLLQFSTTKKVL